MDSYDVSRAILAGDVEKVKSYVQEGGSFHKVTLVDAGECGRRPLVLCAMAEARHGGSAAVTRLVREHSTPEDVAEALVSLASEDSTLSEARALLESGAAPDGRYQNQTALQRATGNRNPKMVHLLLSFGADPNAAGEYGTALEEAKSISYDGAYLGMMESAMRGELLSPYDFVDLEDVKHEIAGWREALRAFCVEHPDEVFYALALDAGSLKLGSEAAFERTLAEARVDSSRYDSPEAVARLRASVGDFAYRVRLGESAGVSLEGLDFSYMARRVGENRTKKDLVREGLVVNQETLLEGMQRSEDFWVGAPGHGY